MSTPPAVEQHSARRQLKVLRRRLPIILTCLILVPAAAVGYSLSQPTEYTAKAVLLFRQPGFDQTLLGAPFFTATQDPAREAATNVNLVTLGVVPEKVAKRIGGGITGDTVASEVAIAQEGQSDLVSISATDRSKKRSAAIANAFAEQFIAFRRDADRSKIQEAARLSQKQLAALPPEEVQGNRGRVLRQRIQTLDNLAAVQTGNAEVVHPAQVPTGRSAPTPRRDGIIGVGLGLLLGLGLAFLIDRLDRRLRDVKEVEEIVERPVLGAVPRSRVLSRGRIGKGGLPAGEAEAFRMLRANLRYFNVDREIKSVLVTSAAPGDGKSTVAANLAFAAAEAGASTLLLEADLRHPTLAKLLNARPAPGLTNALASSLELTDVIQRVPVPGRTGKHGTRELDVVVSGPIPPNPTDLMESARIVEFLRQSEQRYDLVVIDTPPASVVSDAVPLLNKTSGVLVVVRLGKTTRESLMQLHNQLTYLEAPTLGIVVNSIGRDSEAYGFEYAYGYGYGEPASENGEVPDWGGETPSGGPPSPIEPVPVDLNPRSPEKPAPAATKPRTSSPAARPTNGLSSGPPAGSPGLRNLTRRMGRRKPGS